MIKLYINYWQICKYLHPLNSLQAFCTEHYLGYSPHLVIYLLFYSFLCHCKNNFWILTKTGFLKSTKCMQLRHNKKIYLHLLVVYIITGSCKYINIKITCQTVKIRRLTWYYCSPPFVKAGDIKTHSSICPLVCSSVTINFNLAHIFWSINDRALIFGMWQAFSIGTMRWPWPLIYLEVKVGRWEPQFFEFACLFLYHLLEY